jgi:hypothetical protein
MQHEEHCELVVRFELDPACTCGAHERAENVRLKRQLREATDERDRLRSCADGRHLDIIAAAAAVDRENERLRKENYHLRCLLDGTCS